MMQSHILLQAASQKRHPLLCKTTGEYLFWENTPIIIERILYYYYY